MMGNKKLLFCIITFSCVVVSLLVLTVGSFAYSIAVDKIDPAEFYEYRNTLDFCDGNDYIGYLFSNDRLTESIVKGFSFTYYYNDQKLEERSSIPANKLIISYSPTEDVISIYQTTWSYTLSEQTYVIYPYDFIKDLEFSVDGEIYCNDKEIYLFHTTSAGYINPLEPFSCSFDLSETIDGETFLSHMCGDNLTWELDSDGVLTITGTGEMYDYADGNSPFAGDNTIVDVFIRSEGITSIGSGAFYDCSNLMNITIGGTITSIGANAFSGCNCLAYVNYIGRNEQWAAIQIGPNNEPLLAADRDYLVITVCGYSFMKNIDYAIADWNSSDYNVELARLLSALSEAVYDRDKIESAYDSLGFDSFGIYDYDVSLNYNTCGYALGFKRSRVCSDDVICFVTARGTNTEDPSDIITDANIFLTGIKHSGFSKSADNIYNNIQTQIKKQGITGTIKYVLTGHSLGAATANLLAVKLMEEGVPASDIYDYNFACPDVACDVFSLPDYDNIFNICNSADAVAHLPGALLNRIGLTWQKYGKTYWFTREETVSITQILNEHEMKKYVAYVNSHPWPSQWEYDVSVFGLLYGWLTTALCPVDVIITDTEGKRIASVIDGEVNYYDSFFGDVIILTFDDKKVIYVNGENDYNVLLIGSDSGTMTYSVEKYNLLTQETIESKTFSNVVLTNGKTMYSPVSDAITANDVELFVVQNDDGKYVITQTVDTDGSETDVKNPTETEQPSEDPIDKKCKYCDTIHPNTFIGKLTQFFHNILYFFAHLFGKM